MLKYIRFKLFGAVLNPVSSFSRRKRAKLFVRKMKLKENMRVLDVGGQPHIWDYVKFPLEITCLNLPGISVKTHNSHHKITYVEGDGCNMPEFHEGQFDLVFSNSVIEHVGNKTNRKAFANEIRRLSKSYWIQAPYKYFPIEAHCGMPFWWFYPKKVRLFFLERWRKKLPAWTNMVEGTDIVSAKEIRGLFPEARIIMEWLVFPKSIIASSNVKGFS